MYSITTKAPEPLCQHADRVAFEGVPPLPPSAKWQDQPSLMRKLAETAENKFEPVFSSNNHKRLTLRQLTFANPI